MGLVAQGEMIAIPQLLDEMRKIAGKSDAGGIIYLVIGALIIFGIGFFFMMRHVLVHTREIHAEANKTNNENAERFQSGMKLLTDTFSSECAANRELAYRNQMAARDMVHVARDLAWGSVSQKELIAAWQKKEEEQRQLAERAEHDPSRRS